MRHSAKLLLAAVVAAGLFAGCSKGDDKTSSTSSISVSTVKKSLDFGKDEANSQKVELTNETGLDIESIALVRPELSSNPENLMPSGEVWDKGEKANLFISEENKQAELLNLEIKAKSGDEEKTYTLTNLPLSELAETAALKLEGDNLYLTWMKDGSEHSTLQADSSQNSETPEGAVVEVQTEVVEQVPEEAPAEDAPYVPEYVEPVYQEPVYEDPGTVDQPVVEEPAAPSVPSQGEENCVNPGDLVLNPDA